MQTTTAYLDVKDEGAARRVPLDNELFTIGRNFTNLLVIEESMASRFHCVIEKVNNGYQVRDLDSRNGTVLNGKLVKTAPLTNGDVIAIGKSVIKVFLPATRRTTVSANPPPRSAAGLRPSAVQPGDEFDDTLDALASLVNDDESTSIASDSSPEQTDDSPTYVPSPRKSAPIESAQEYDRVLRERAEALPDRGFDETQISLVNARGKPVHSTERDNTSEAVSVVRLLLLICFRSRATDIHVEPKSDDVQIRVRVDGNMVDVVHVTKELGIKLSSVVKILADIDISQRNVVQEGHFSARIPTKTKSGGTVERRVDYRVSFAPAMHGQKLVVRILDESNAPLHIDDLQLPAKARQIIRQASEQDAGMVLVCGPTGSGKTTTLYAILRDIDVSQHNVVTIEDPVEIQLEGVTQIPVNEPQGNTFSNLLRSVLRQDPDVILIGEIRDAETARVGVQAGMTGHLVFSTVHARDALSGMFRLLDLGVEPYVVASGLHVVVAQRLVRQLCPHCKVSRKPDAEQAERLTKNGFPNVQKVYQPRGCRKCLGTGHFGRRGVFEVLSATQALRDTIVKSPQQQECMKAMNTDNFISLTNSGYRLVAEGVACIEEVERIIA